ncbi:MAG: hypothetical protein JSV40_05510 [Deltaproteobacteria bacterium]|nr:MAG: hypothetical protein JSV40_05510 [Deltaproteobacteria bacterium]
MTIIGGGGKKYIIKWQGNKPGGLKTIDHYCTSNVTHLETRHSVGFG